MYEQGTRLGSTAVADDEVIGLREAVLLFGGLAIIFQGLGAVLARINGWPIAPTACLIPFIYAAAGFMGARHASIANGVWAGIAVASLDSTLGVLLAGVINPAPYRGFSEGISAGTPGGATFFVLAIGLALGVFFVFVFGAFFGVIGAAISHSSPFRPRHHLVAR
jgi:hypothetical protein